MLCSCPLRVHSCCCLLLLDEPKSINMRHVCSWYETKLSQNATNVDRCVRVCSKMFTIELAGRSIESLPSFGRVEVLELASLRSSRGSCVFACLTESLTRSRPIVSMSTECCLSRRAFRLLRVLAARVDECAIWSTSPLRAVATLTGL